VFPVNCSTVAEYLLQSCSVSLQIETFSGKKNMATHLAAENRDHPTGAPPQEPAIALRTYSELVMPTRAQRSGSSRVAASGALLALAVVGVVALLGGGDMRGELEQLHIDMEKQNHFHRVFQKLEKKPSSGDVAQAARARKHAIAAMSPEQARNVLVKWGFLPPSHGSSARHQSLKEVSHSGDGRARWLASDALSTVEDHHAEASRDQEKEHGAEKDRDDDLRTRDGEVRNARSGASGSRHHSQLARLRQEASDDDLDIFNADFAKEVKKRSRRADSTDERDEEADSRAVEHDREIANRAKAAREHGAEHVRKPARDDDSRDEEEDSRAVEHDREIANRAKSAREREAEHTREPAGDEDGEGLRAKDKDVRARRGSETARRPEDDNRQDEHETHTSGFDHLESVAMNLAAAVHDDQQGIRDRKKKLANDRNKLVATRELIDKALSHLAEKSRESVQAQKKSQHNTISKVLHVVTALSKSQMSRH